MEASCGWAGGVGSQVGRGCEQLGIREVGANWHLSRNLEAVVKFAAPIEASIGHRPTMEYSTLVAAQTHTSTCGVVQSPRPPAPPRNPLRNAVPVPQG